MASTDEEGQRKVKAIGEIVAELVRAHDAGTDVDLNKYMAIPL